LVSPFTIDIGGKDVDNADITELFTRATRRTPALVILEDIDRFSSVRFEPGTLYGALARLEREGLIAALEPAGRRRPYALTPSGHSVLEARLATMERVVAVGRQRAARSPLEVPQ